MSKKEGYSRKDFLERLSVMMQMVVKSERADRDFLVV